MRWSLQWKIQFWHGLILTVLALILGVLFYRHERNIMQREIDWMLQQSLRPLAGFAFIEPYRNDTGPGDRNRPKRSAEESSNQIGEWQFASFSPSNSTDLRFGPRDIVEAFEKVLEPQGYYYAIWKAPDKQPIHRSANAPDIVPPDLTRPGSWLRDIPNERRELFHRQRQGSIIVGYYTKNFNARLSTLRWQIVFVGLFGVLLALWIGKYLVSVSLKPLQEIRRSSRQIADGELTTRIEKAKLGDIVEMKELGETLNTTFQSLEKLFERQTAFTADASHELRTPLTALIAQVKRGQHGGRSEEDYQSIFEVCDRSLVRLKRIVDDLLDLSRYDSGQFELDCEELSLGPFLETIAEDYRPMVEAEDCRLIYQTASGSVYCDPFRIEQVISNLIGNAIKHNKEPVNVFLNANEVDGWAVIQVEDSGVGIAPEHCEHLFERFYRKRENGDGNQNSALGPNTGLGLAISKAIIDAHGGTIQVGSQPGVSTVFEIRLPTHPKN